MREAKGLDKDGPWSIWTKGCEDGEMPAEVEERIDGKFLTRVKLSEIY